MLRDVCARWKSTNRHWSIVSVSGGNRTGRRLDGLKNFQQRNINGLAFGGSTEGSFAAFGRGHVLVGYRNHRQQEEEREVNRHVGKDKRKDKKMEIKDEGRSIFRL